jgi:arginyl-tRNA synthetase
VGAEQKFYFEQLFAMGKKLGYDVENIHIWFGTIDQVTEEGKREKMSSRKGVVLLEAMLDDAENPTWLLNGKPAIQNDSGVYVENVFRICDTCMMPIEVHNPWNDKETKNG